MVVVVIFLLQPKGGEKLKKFAKDLVHRDSIVVGPRFQVEIPSMATAKNRSGFRQIHLALEGPLTVWNPRTLSNGQVRLTLLWGDQYPDSLEYDLDPHDEFYVWTPDHQHMVDLEDRVNTLLRKRLSNVPMAVSASGRAHGKTARRDVEYVEIF